MKRAGIKPPPKPWGDADQGLRGICAGSGCAGIHASPSSTTTRWSRTRPRWCGRATGPDHGLRQDPGRLEQPGTYIPASSASRPDQVRVLNPYLGGGFGLGPAAAIPALPRRAGRARSRALGARGADPRPDVHLRAYRPTCGPDGVAGRRARTGKPHSALLHDCRVTAPRASRITRRTIVNWSGMLYGGCDNVEARLRDWPRSTRITPADMRAPGRGDSGLSSPSKAPWTNWPTPPAPTRSNCA